MPNTGTPIDNTPVSHGGAPASYTEFGPPDNTTPEGSNFRISSTLAVQGRMALNTCCSRIRRAISCVYCPPKSSTTIPPRSLLFSSLDLHKAGCYLSLYSAEGGCCCSLFFQEGRASARPNRNPLKPALA